jgi:putative tryptophan/tyrosine transport system substrate-binding protein
MRRREVIGALAGTAAWPIVARAQTGPARIALLGSGWAQSSAIFVEALIEGLGEHGLVQGRDYELDLRWAEGDYGRFPALAAEIVRHRPRVILASTISGVRAAQKTGVPVLMLHINDPVANGLIASLARPGGNTTGLSNLNEDLTPKLLDILRAVLPEARVVAVLLNPRNPSNLLLLDGARGEARSRGVTLRPVEFKAPDALEKIFEALGRDRPDALMMLADATLLDLRDRIAALALRHRIGAISTYPELTALGGLVSYGTRRSAFYRRAGYYVRKILDGAKPADLPVEQPARFELSVNLKTAKLLGIAVADSFLARADEVIE